MSAHVFNLGHGVLPHTPPENVERLVQLVHGS
jgi:uroporphyrinogen decarboxylase